MARDGDNTRKMQFHRVGAELFKFKAADGTADNNIHPTDAMRLV